MGPTDGSFLLYLDRVISGHLESILQLITVRAVLLEVVSLARMTVMGLCGSRQSLVHSVCDV